MYSFHSTVIVSPGANTLTLAVRPLAVCPQGPVLRSPSVSPGARGAGEDRSTCAALTPARVMDTPNTAAREAAFLMGGIVGAGNLARDARRMAPGPRSVARRNRGSPLA